MYVERIELAVDYKCSCSLGCVRKADAYATSIFEHSESSQIARIWSRSKGSEIEMTQDLDRSYKGHRGAYAGCILI